MVRPSLKAAIGGTRKLAQEILEKGQSQLSKGMQTPEIAALTTKTRASDEWRTRYSHCDPCCAHWGRAHEVGYQCTSSSWQRTGRRSLLQSVRYLF
jgi:hypothetical protein